MRHQNLRAVHQELATIYNSKVPENRHRTKDAVQNQLKSLSKTARHKGARSSMPTCADIQIYMLTLIEERIKMATTRPRLVFGPGVQSQLPVIDNGEIVIPAHPLATAYSMTGSLDISQAGGLYFNSRQYGRQLAAEGRGFSGYIPSDGPYDLSALGLALIVSDGEDYNNGHEFISKHANGFHDASGTAEDSDVGSGGDGKAWWGC